MISIKSDMRLSTHHQLATDQPIRGLRDPGDQWEASIGHLYKHCDEPRDTRDIDTVYVGSSDRQNPVTRNVTKFQLFQ